MAVPTSYDEDELATYMLAELDVVGRVLAVSVAPTAAGDHGDLSETVNDVLLDLGRDLSTVTTEALIKQLRALAAVHAWRFAKKRAASRYDMKDGTTTLNRSQWQPMIEKNLAQAERIAAAVGALPSGAAGVRVHIARVRYPHDPYRPIDLSSSGLGGETVP